MEPTPEPKQPALRAVYWREEILELALWLRGEGLDEHLGVDVVCQYLDLDDEQAAEHLNRLHEQGYLDRLADGRYALTPRAERYALHLLRGARAVPMPAPGNCGPHCFCHVSPVEAIRCARKSAD